MAASDEHPAGAAVSRLEQMEIHDQLATAERRLRRDPWNVLLVSLVACAVQYPVLGAGLGLAISCAMVAIVFGLIGLRNRRRTKRLAAELRPLLESGESR